MAPELVTGLSAERVARNLAEIREQIGNPDVEILAAVKYVGIEDLGILAEAGITIAGENRAQELEAKAAQHPELTWDFIGQLQSRKVKVIAPLVRRIHSIASDSAVGKLAALDDVPELFVQVDIAGEASKAGIAPADLPAFLERSPVTFSGLMVMPPFTEDPENSRPWFAAARELAAGNGLAGLSMGTTQDFAVAVEEGATVVRIGGRLYR